MAPRCQIRAARSADLRWIAAIETASFADPWSVTQFRAHLDDVVLVADRAGTVVGYLVAQSLVPEAEILNIAVAPDQRGAGIGAGLLRTGLERLAALGVRTAYLEVRESNRVARRMYERAGFRPAGRRRGYYRAPSEDAVVMRCELSAGLGGA